MEVVFHAVVAKLPGQLQTALYESGMCDAGMLATYPRTPVEQLMKLFGAVLKEEPCMVRRATSPREFPNAASSSAVSPSFPLPSVLLSSSSPSFSSSVSLLVSASQSLSDSFPLRPSLVGRGLSSGKDASANMFRSISDEGWGPSPLSERSNSKAAGLQGEIRGLPGGSITVGCGNAGVPETAGTRSRQRAHQHEATIQANAADGARDAYVRGEGGMPGTAGTGECLVDRVGVDLGLGARPRGARSDSLHGESSLVAVGTEDRIGSMMDAPRELKLRDDMTSTTISTPPTYTDLQSSIRTRDDLHSTNMDRAAHTTNTHQDNATPPSTCPPEPSDGCKKSSRRTRKTPAPKVHGVRVDGSRVSSGTDVAKILETNPHLDTTQNLEQRLGKKRTFQKSELKSSGLVQIGRKGRDKKVANSVMDDHQQPVQNAMMDACRSSGAIDSTRDDPSVPHGEPRRPDDSSSMFLGEGPQSSRTMNSLLQQPCRDIDLLYLSLVADGALPAGFIEDFRRLENVISPAADQQLRFLAQEDNLSAAVTLHRKSVEHKEKVDVQKTAQDQLVLAAAQPPRRFSSRLQRSAFQGPNARREAEERERERWISLLGQLIRGSQTPMGVHLQLKPGDISLLGAGRRATTIRSRTRVIRRFLAWLALNYGQQYPSCLAHYVDYLRVRLSEPATRGALKSVHAGFVFLDEVTGTAPTDRVTNGKMYEVVYKELLNQASPGRPSKQAPRMYVSMLQGLEELVCNQRALPYFRLYGWWILLQNWGTLRFGDHRGILPSEIRVDSAGLSATLTRSKTIGPDKATQARAIMIDSSCWIAKPEWIHEGWATMGKIADFPRDYLLPAPSTNYLGTCRAELRYDQGFALQNRVLSVISAAGVKLFTKQVTQFWTPHSGRSFMPTCTQVLGFDQPERNYLGGWSPQKSDRYTRTARRRIVNMQRAVMTVITQGNINDSLAESETSLAFAEYLESRGMDLEGRTDQLCRLESWNAIRAERKCEQVIEQHIEEPHDSAMLVDPEIPVNPEDRPDKRRKGENVRSAILGQNPRQTRQEVRQRLEKGFYAAYSGRKRIRVLHLLGSCYAVPGIDYPEYEFLGEAFPAKSSFQQVCQLCAKKNINPQIDAEDSDVSHCSSSSDEQ